MNKLLAKGKSFFIKNGSDILLYLGLIAGAAAILSAVKDTQKAQEVLDEHVAVKEILSNAVEEGQIISEDDEVLEYDAELFKTDSRKLLLQTTGKLAKIYALTFGLATLSGASILCSHGILKKRNVALTAAYNVLDRGFTNYRKAVVDTYGEEVDKNFHLGRTFEKVKVKEADESGKERMVTKSVPHYKKVEEYSDFARIFDETNPLWKKDPSFNLMTLHQQQINCNRYLRANGHLFLNEVYDLLGFERTPEGQVVGWIWDGDENKVDFGLFDKDNQAVIDFQNGYEPSIVLDFNVDGVIIDKI